MQLQQICKFFNQVQIPFIAFPFILWDRKFGNPYNPEKIEIPISFYWTKYHITVFFRDLSISILYYGYWCYSNVCEYKWLSQFVTWSQGKQMAPNADRSSDLHTPKPCALKKLDLDKCADFTLTKIWHSDVTAFTVQI